MQDALAVTLGVGWVSGFAYVVADGADLIAHVANIGVLPALLAVVYIIAIVGGHLRYRSTTASTTSGPNATGPRQT
jgi:hypothetical protein